MDETRKSFLEEEVRKSSVEQEMETYLRKELSHEYSSSQVVRNLLGKAKSPEKSPENKPSEEEVVMALPISLEKEVKGEVMVVTVTPGTVQEVHMEVRGEVFEEVTSEVQAVPSDTTDGVDGRVAGVEPVLPHTTTIRSPDESLTTLEVQGDVPSSVDTPEETAQVPPQVILQEALLVTTQGVLQEAPLVTSQEVPLVYSQEVHQAPCQEVHQAPVIPSIKVSVAAPSPSRIPSRQVHQGAQGAHQGAQGVHQGVQGLPCPSTSPGEDLRRLECRLERIVSRSSGSECSEGSSETSGGRAAAAGPSQVTSRLYNGQTASSRAKYGLTLSFLRSLL